MEKRQISKQLYDKKVARIEAMKQRLIELNTIVIEEFVSGGRTDSGSAVAPSKAERDNLYFQIERAAIELSNYVITDMTTKNDPTRVEIGDVAEILLSDKAGYKEQFECVLLEELDIYSDAERKELYPGYDELDFTSKNSPIGAAINGGRAGMITPVELPAGVRGTKEYMLEIIEITKFENINAKRRELK